MTRDLEVRVKNVVGKQSEAQKDATETILVLGLCGLGREQKRLWRGRDFPGWGWLAYWGKEELYSFLSQETGTIHDVPEPGKGLEGLRTQARLNWGVATGMEARCLRQPKLRASASNTSPST